MNSGPSPATHDAALAAAIFAADPAGTGLCIRGRSGPVRDALVAFIANGLPRGAPFRRMPPNIADGRLLGGIDLAATLQAGRPVFDRGLLAESDGGAIVVPMAERMSPLLAARLSSALDSGKASVAREGFSTPAPARLGIVAFDEGLEDEDRPPHALLDRLALIVDVDLCGELPMPEDIAERIAKLRGSRLLAPLPAALLKALAATAAAIGVHSSRTLLQAARVARMHAALAGRDGAGEEDAAVAARLVLAPRATLLPVSDQEAAPEPSEPDNPANGDADEPQNLSERSEPEDIVLEAARAAIPPHLLRLLSQSPEGLRRSSQAGRMGATKISLRRGHPAGTRRGDPGGGARLNVIETLRAAAPWQRLRKRGSTVSDTQRVAVRREDFRVTRFSQRSETVTVFAVDASGSSALHRLAEAKGAVELLLADCYVRRDQVALFAFRGETAELLLPPTRSLARAKKMLAALPGGGGTPLAAALDATSLLAQGVRRQGRTPSIVLLTDGRANIARSGEKGRDHGEADALLAAKALRAQHLGAILIDTSPSPQVQARELADAMGARYLPMPRADAVAVSAAARSLIAGR